eukprot:3400022-Alexandrium_andersonii.AAC.1
MACPITMLLDLALGLRDAHHSLPAAQRLRVCVSGRNLCQEKPAAGALEALGWSWTARAGWKI